METNSIMPEDALSENIYFDGLPKILPPYENGIFQAVLTLPEAHDALVSTVAAVLDRTVKTVMLRNNDAPARDALPKREEYDINCVVDCEDGDQCAIEMQASQMKGDNKANDHRNIKWRTVFNLCDLHSNQPGRGLDYGGFVRSYQVVFCNYKIFDFDNELVERFVLCNQRGIELCDAVMAILIDLTQAKEIAKKSVSDMTNIECWVVFYALANDANYSQVVAEITKEKEGIAVAYDMLTSISQNPDERARFRSRRIWLQDREHEHAVARKEGREEARAEFEVILADKDAEIAYKDAKYELLIADKDTALAEWQSIAADKDTALADKDAEIAALRALLGQGQ